MLDAIVIIEVLSPSTANYDHNEKFDNYKKLKSLRHYLLIEQKQMKVTHHFLDDDKRWQSETFVAPEDTVELRRFSVNWRCAKSINASISTRAKLQLCPTKQQPRPLRFPPNGSPNSRPRRAARFDSDSNTRLSRPTNRF